MKISHSLRARSIYTEQHNEHISHSEVTWSISTQWIYLRWRRFISQWN